MRCFVWVAEFGQAMKGIFCSRKLGCTHLFERLVSFFVCSLSRDCKLGIRKVSLIRSSTRVLSTSTDHFRTFNHHCIMDSSPFKLTVTSRLRSITQGDKALFSLSLQYYHIYSMITPILGWVSIDWWMTNTNYIHMYLLLLHGWLSLENGKVPNRAMFRTINPLVRKTHISEQRT